MRVVPFALVCSVLSAACSSKQPAPPAPQPPAAPAGLAATGGSAQISLTWTAVSGATSYIVLRGDSAGAEAALTPPATSATASYTDAGLAAGKTYFYLVQAVNNAGASASSNEASATTAPPAPPGLAAAGGSGQISLTWAPAPGPTSYLILPGDAAGAGA